MSNQKFKGEERALYLFKESPCNVLDSLWDVIKNAEQKMRTEGIEDLPTTVYLNIELFPEFVSQLRKVKGQVYMIPPGRSILWERYTITPFFASMEFEETRPDCAVVMILHQDSNGLRIYGL